MPRLPVVSGKQTIKALEKLGFEQVRQHGSHIILKKTTSQGNVGCVVPLHSELALGTLKGILKQAKVNLVDFVEEL